MRQASRWIGAAVLGVLAGCATQGEQEQAGMVIGMERLHLSRIRQLVPEAHPLYLLSDFDRNALPGSAIEDPWYGDDDDFKTTLGEIEAAVPEVIKRARELVS